MGERAEIVIIGGGQAGLAVSYYLSGWGREHVVLERGRVAETWRTRRWDGFYLNTPNWTLQLPGGRYRGDQPHRFMARDQVAAYLDHYAESFHTPVRSGVDVVSLRRSGGGRYLLATSAGAVEAKTVIVATGAFQQPRRPPLACELPAQVLQLHASAYRSPAQLPDGGVLVVGSGSSGCQIAEELARNDRSVYLSVGNCGWGPRRYRGRDFMRWAIDLGLMDETVDRSPDARLACNQSLSGNDGGHDCHPRTLARLGVVLVGRLEGIRGRTLHLRPDLDDNLAKADEFAERFKRQVDEHVLAAHLDVPDTPADDALPSKPASADRRREIDLDRSGISTILWSNGYRPDFDWIELPLFDNDGWPGQVRGVTRSAGLYFVGLHWLYKRKSSLLFGVGEDAEFITNHIVRASAGPRSRLPRRPPGSPSKRALLQ